ncbi:uncharacterized protein LOC129906540 [Episyrphus balteatus]|uniref:uncharacterized protein LOC129906540 n=1 Tax=Episyrphus balteatus TaxID=286459 RepID=UPI00248656B5|nr:uncharacterized protein LOC129906540 [Episyrphus balteatus]
MFSSVSFSVCIALAFASSRTLAYPLSEYPYISVNIIATELNVTTDLPQGVKLTPLTAVITDKGLIRYKVGRREPNDRLLIETTKGGASGKEPVNYQMGIKFGSTITAAYIDIDHQSKDSQAYAVFNGTQQQLEFLIAINNVDHFGYATKLFVNNF